MEGCYKMYSKRECDATERARLEMSLSQPRSEHNYTKVGFKKTRVPKGFGIVFNIKLIRALFLKLIEAWEPLIQFYEKHKEEEHLEQWSRGYTYVNVWESPSYVSGQSDNVPEMQLKTIFFLDDQL